MKNSKLPVTEELDFHYLLTLLPPLHNQPKFCWLPELFSIVGHEALIQLCKYAGGETIKIPTLDELSSSLEALQWFYDVNISKKHDVSEIPSYIKPLYDVIYEVYNAPDNSKNDTIS